jgi:hypothetical protein
MSDTLLNVTMTGLISKQYPKDETPAKSCSSNPASDTEPVSVNQLAHAMTETTRFSTQKSHWDLQLLKNSVRAERTLNISKLSKSPQNTQFPAMTQHEAQLSQ